MIPKVSVALRSYNQKEFLIEAIESVLIQDYQNLEIVVGDDGSTDGSQEILMEYEKKFPQMFKLILNQNNIGRTPNQNMVFFNCTGKYIAWLDGDDLFLPGKVKKQVELLESRPDCTICWHEVEVFDSRTGEVLENFDIDPTITTPKEGGIEVLFSRYFIHPCAAMTRRDASPETGYDIRIPISPDPLFWFETAVNGNICFIPEVLSRYRRHDNNLTATFSSKEHQVYKFLTFTILSAKYPQFAKHSRISSGWASHLYRAGIQKVREHQGKAARELFIESLRQGWVSWKWFGWFLRSCLN